MEPWSLRRTIGTNTWHRLSMYTTAHITVVLYIWMGTTFANRLGLWLGQEHRIQKPNIIHDRYEAAPSRSLQSCSKSIWWSTASAEVLVWFEDAQSNLAARRQGPSQDSCLQRKALAFEQDVFEARGCLHHWGSIKLWCTCVSCPQRTRQEE